MRAARVIRMSSCILLRTISRRQIPVVVTWKYWNPPYRRYWVRCAKVRTRHINTATILMYNNVFYRLCPDIDECATNNHTCHPSATCVNTIGSYECKCLTNNTDTGIISSECKSSKYIISLLTPRLLSQLFAVGRPSRQLHRRDLPHPLRLRQSSLHHIRRALLSQTSYSSLSFSIHFLS